MSSHYGHLQQIKYKLIIIVTMLECKTVTLRTRPLKNGMLSYYLDYYPGYRDQETMKTIRHEGLNIYIYANPKNERERNFNATMSEKAEAIRCRRFESIVNDRYDFFDRHKLKADFWNTIVSSFVSMTKSGNLCTTISTTSFMANVLLKKLILTFAISSGSIC